MNSLAHTFQQVTEVLARAAGLPPEEIFVCGRRFGQNIPYPIRILYRCEAYYDVDERLLGLLRAGRTPDDLELVPVEEKI